MSENIQSISNGNYILQGTVATSAGIVGDGTTQNPLRADETVLLNSAATSTANINLSEPFNSFEKVDIYWRSYGRYFVTTIADSGQCAVGAVYNDQANPQITTLFYDGAPNSTTLSFNKGFHQHITAAGNTQRTPDSNVYIYKIIGINRKAQ